jgi:hypothetical protein
LLRSPLDDLLIKSLTQLIQWRRPARKAVPGTSPSLDTPSRDGLLAYTLIVAEKD